MQNTERAPELIERLGNALSKLTVLTNVMRDRVVQSLMAVTYAAAAGDPRSASASASELTAALIGCGARRVSGNLMMDYVLDRILMTENPFALSAAAGRMDEALLRAMRRDLAAMRTLSLVDEDMLNGIVCEYAEPVRTNDNAVKLATAAWGGGAPQSAPKEHAPAVRFRFEPPENCWDYGEFELRGSYYADAALEGMYRRFLENDDWTGLVNDLWSFHSVCGCGLFLKYRNFCTLNGGLEPMPDLRPGDFVSLADAEYRTLLNNAIAFMRDESAKPMLLYGPSGMGKTTMMLELTDELPQLRLVYASTGSTRGKLLPLLDRLRAQPLKFMLLFDDLDPSEVAGVPEPMLPLNVLVAACAPAPVLPGLFEVTEELPRMQLNEFARAVATLLEAKQVVMPQESVRSACVDYQVDTKCEFNVAAAIRVKELLLS